MSQGPVPEENPCGALVQILVCSLFAALAEVSAADRKRVESTTVAEDIMRTSGEARISPRRRPVKPLSKLMPKSSWTRFCVLNPRRRRNLALSRLSGKPR